MRPLAVLSALVVFAVAGGSVAAQIEPTNAASAVGPAAADFGLARYPGTQTASPAAGSTGKFLIEITPSGGFTGPVTLATSGLPASIGQAFLPTSITTTGTSILTLTPGVATPQASYPFTISATSGGITKSVTAQLNVDFSLVPKCLVNVSGLVTDSISGSPIGTATVTGGGKSSVTGADGRYSLVGVELADNNAPLDLTVTASKETPGLNRVGQYWQSAPKTQIACERASSLDIALVPVKKATMSGKVFVGRIDNNNFDAPVPTDVALPNTPVQLSTIASARTNATGDFNFVDANGVVGFQLLANNVPLPASTPLKITSPTTDAAGAALPTRGRYWAPADILVGPIVPDQVVVRPPVGLIKMCTTAISGIVRDEAGAPVANTPVQIRAVDVKVNDPVSTTTGADGRYNVPAILFGYNNKPGKLRVTVPNADFNGETADATCGGALVQDVRFPPAPAATFGLVSGKIVDQDTNAPVPGAQVRVQPCTPISPTTDCLQVIARADGTFGPIRVPIIAPATSVTGLLAVTQPSTPPPSHWPKNVAITVVAGPNAQPDTKLLRRKFATVQGKVIDSVTQVALPAVSMGLTGGFRVPCPAPCATNATGDYKFEQVELGTNNAVRAASISARLTGYWDKSVNVNVNADQVVTSNISLVKKCPAATVSGTVINAATLQPLEGANISGASGTPVTATTDAEGRFSITGVPTGADNALRTFNLTASKGGFYSESRSVSVTCGAPVTVDFGRPASLVGVIAGIVTRSPGNVPVADAQISTEFGAATTTGADGRYRIPGAPVNLDGSPRTWTVTAAVTGLEPQTLPATVRRNETTTLDFSFASPVLNVDVTNDANRDGTFADSEQLPGAATYPRVATVRVTIVNPSATPRTITGIDDDLVGALGLTADTTAPNGTSSCDNRVGVVLAPTAGTACFFDVTLAAAGVAPRVNTVTVTGDANATGSDTSTMTFGVPPTSTTTTTSTSTTTTSTTTTSTTTTSVPPTSTTTTSTTTTSVPPTSTTTTSTTTTSVPPTSTTTTTTIPTPRPVVTGLSPTSGSTAGGNSVIVTGTGLTGATAVRFGATAATGFTVNSATQITATAPVGSAGIVDVSIVTPGGTSAPSAATKYTYVAANRAPVVYGVSPGSGPGGGGNEVILAGIDLTGATSVTFGGAPASAFTVVNAGEIRVTAPTGGTGLVPIRVTTPNGTSPITDWTYYRYGAQQVCFLFWCWWL